MGGRRWRREGLRRACRLVMCRLFRLDEMGVRGAARYEGGGSVDQLGSVACSCFCWRGAEMVCVFVVVAWEIDIHSTEVVVHG